MSNPQEQVYIEFLNYDWEKSEDFQKHLKELGLAAGVTSNSTSAADSNQLIEQAKSFFFCQETGHILSLDDYEDWKLHNGDKYDRNAKIIEIAEDEDLKSNNDKASKETSSSARATNIEESGQANSSNGDENGEDGEPPYSSNYQNLVELIMTGKPVPGIKEIPDTVLRDQGSVSHEQQRKKPWEQLQN